LKTKSKPINFDEFLDLICPKIGDLKTKEGLRTIYSHFDKSEDGVLDFEELKATARQSGDLIND
jgi:Ca2+-binding EF-hand superfamily protein